MNPWEGISDQDRACVERAAQSLGISVDAARLMFRYGQMAGWDKAILAMCSKPQQPQHWAERAGIR